VKSAQSNNIFFELILNCSKVKNDTEENVIAQEFYGPPTSCDELATLGYTLNGNYLVNGKNLSENHHKVEMIACLFKKPPGIEEGKCKLYKQNL